MAPPHDFWGGTSGAKKLVLRAAIERHLKRFSRFGGKNPAVFYGACSNHFRAPPRKTGGFLSRGVHGGIAPFSFISVLSTALHDGTAKGFGARKKPPLRPHKVPDGGAHAQHAPRTVRYTAHRTIRPFTTTHAPTTHPGHPYLLSPSSRLTYPQLGHQYFTHNHISIRPHPIDTWHFHGSYLAPCAACF